MEGTAVQKIAELAVQNGQIFEVEGKKYARGTLNMVRTIDRPSPIIASTLSGLYEYVNKNPEILDFKNFMVQVENYGHIALLERFTGDEMMRSTLFICALDAQLPVFPFDKYLDTEDFLIKMRALFEPSETMDEITAIISKIQVQEEINLGDDGLSQTVSVKKGLSGAVSKPETTKGTYRLSPYRTFRDIKQPESAFILRLKSVEGELPKAALFDAEGGAWRDAAIHAIADDIRRACPEIPVIA